MRSLVRRAVRRGRWVRRVQHGLRQRLLLRHRGRPRVSGVGRRRARRLRDMPARVLAGRLRAPVRALRRLPHRVPSVRSRLPRRMLRSVRLDASRFSAHAAREPQNPARINMSTIGETSQKPAENVSFRETVRGSSPGVGAESQAKKAETFARRFLRASTALLAPDLGRDEGIDGSAAGSVGVEPRDRFWRERDADGRAPSLLVGDARAARPGARWRAIATRHQASASGSTARIAARASSQVGS